MIPSSTIVDLSGPRRLRAVRIIDGTIYGERRTHPSGEDTSDPAIVSLGELDGEVVEVRPNRRWTIGDTTASKHGGCSCGGRLRALRAWTP